MAAPARLPEVGDAASVQMSIDAIEFQLSLVDSDVRKVLSALHGASNATYAGSSSATPEGKAFLEQELDGLMAAKARYKEIKLARMQLQQSFPVRQAIDSEIARVDAEVREVLGAIQGSRVVADDSPYAGESKGALEDQLDGLMDEKAKYKEKKLSIVHHNHKGLEEKAVQQQQPANLAGVSHARCTMWPKSSPAYYTREHAAITTPDRQHYSSAVSPTPPRYAESDGMNFASNVLGGDDTSEPPAFAAHTSLVLKKKRKRENCNVCLVCGFVCVGPPGAHVRKTCEPFIPA